jgi:uncharacterized protein
MEFLALGGADEIGASCYLYRRAGGSVLIDAGVRTGLLGAAALPALDGIETAPDAFFLSHAHLDHVGALPLLLARFPKMRCLTTPLSLKLAIANLNDTVKVNAQNGLALFGYREVVAALNRFEVVPSLVPIDIDTQRGERWRLLPTPAGHLPGAHGLLIQGQDELVFHTGDFNNVATHLTEAAWRFPQPPHQIPVVSEATYGDVQLPSRKEQVQRFVAAMSDVLRAGGNVLIPSFALGRAQEIIQTLLTQMAGGLVPRVPIYLDGLVRTVTEIMQDSLEHLPKALQNFAQNTPALFFAPPVQVVTDKAQREAVLAKRGVVVIASSGMLSGGASPIYAHAWLPGADNGLFLVGYQDEDSPGRRLLELQQGGDVVLPTGVVSAYCRVERYALSGHADRGGLLSHIAQFQPSLVALVHGEVGARHSLATTLSKSSPCRLPKNGEVVLLHKPPRQPRPKPTMTTDTTTSAITSTMAHNASDSPDGPDGPLAPHTPLDTANDPLSASLSAAPRLVDTGAVVRHHQQYIERLKLHQTETGFVVDWPEPQNGREQRVLAKLKAWLHDGQYKLAMSRIDGGHRVRLQLSTMRGQLGRDDEAGWDEAGRDEAGRDEVEPDETDEDSGPG